MEALQNTWVGLVRVRSCNWLVPRPPPTLYMGYVYMRYACAYARTYVVSSPDYRESVWGRDRRQSRVNVNVNVHVAAPCDGYINNYTKRPCSKFIQHDPQGIGITKITT